jgi:hypothetical protein
LWGMRVVWKGLWVSPQGWGLDNFWSAVETVS